MGKSVAQENTPVKEETIAKEQPIKATRTGEPKPFTSINEPLLKGQRFEFDYAEKGVIKVGDHYYDVNHMPNGYYRFETEYNSGMLEKVQEKTKDCVLHKDGGKLTSLSDVAISHVGSIEPLFPKLPNHAEINEWAAKGERGKIFERSVYDYYFLQEDLGTGCHHNVNGVGRGDPYFPGLRDNTWIGAPDSMYGRLPNPENCMTYKQVKTMLDNDQQKELKEILGYDVLARFTKKFQMNNYYLK